MHLNSLNKRQLRLNLSLFPRWFSIFRLWYNRVTTVIFITVLLKLFLAFLINWRRFWCLFGLIINLFRMFIIRFMSLNITIGQLRILVGYLILVIVHMIWGLYNYRLILRPVFGYVKGKVLMLIELRISLFSFNRLYNILNIYGFFRLYDLNCRNHYFLLLVLWAIDCMKILVGSESSYIFWDWEMVSCWMSLVVSFAHVASWDSTIGGV